MTQPISGYKMATPTFKNLGTENYPLDKFTVQGATDSMTTCQVLDSEGKNSGTYYWYNEFNDPEQGLLPAGWFDVSGLVPAGIELKPGEAVFFNTTESGVTIQSCGQVPGEITNGVAGYKMLGNGSPVKIAIDNFTVQGATDSMTTCQVLDEGGKNNGTYYWYNEFDDPEQGLLPAGWFDVSGLIPAGIDLEPGDSLLFNSTETGVTATVPSAL